MNEQWRPLEDGQTHSDAVGSAQVFGSADGLFSPAEFEGKPTPQRDFIVDKWIPCGAVTLFTGNGGEGKSRLAMQLLIACTTGGRWLDLDTKHCRTLGIFSEDSKDELHNRTGGILEGSYGDYSDLEESNYMNRKGRDSRMFIASKDAAEGKFTEFFERTRATVLDFGVQLLVLDSLYDFFAGNENQKHQVTQFISKLDDLATEINGAIVIVAHPSKDGMKFGSGDSGSTAWHNKVRARMYMHRIPVDKAVLKSNPHAKGKLVIEPMKANYGPLQKPIDIAYDHGQFVPAYMVGIAEATKPEDDLFGGLK